MMTLSKRSMALLALGAQRVSALRMEAVGTVASDADLMKWGEELLGPDADALLGLDLDGGLRMLQYLVEEKVGVEPCPRVHLISLLGGYRFGVSAGGGGQHARLLLVAQG